MKQNNRLILILGMLMMLFFVLPQLAIAGDPGDNSGDPDAPIDGGVGLLIAAGIGYGVKRIRDERKRKMNKLP